MTIIFLSRYQNKIERGVENYVSELSKGLREEYTVTVLTSFWQLFGKQADIIYPLNGSFQSLGCRLYSWFIGAKLVLGGHAGIGRDDRWSLYMFPDLFIAFSQKGYSWAKHTNPFVKIVKIPHGVDLKQFNPQVKPQKIDLERPIFITVSHMLPYKRVGESVKAVAKLQKGSLLVLGEGPLEKEIDKLGDTLLNNGKRKRYLRLSVLHKEVPSYLTAADVFTLASEGQEAFGLVYLEALACNLPIVATDDSLRHELIGDAGLFIKSPGNSKEYARLLGKTTKEDWDGKPRKQAQNFDWIKIVQIYKDILRQIK